MKKMYEGELLGKFPLKADVEYDENLGEHKIKRLYFDLGDGVEIDIPLDIIPKQAWKTIWDKLGLLPPPLEIPKW